jgi:hypothetical protein
MNRSPKNDNPDPFAWTTGREHLQPRHARFLGELLSVAAAHAPDRRAQADLRIAAGAAFDAANRLQRIREVA